MDFVRLIVRDEENNREVELYLTPQQRERASNDGAYLQQLLDDHDRDLTRDQNDRVEAGMSDDENSEPKSLFLWTEPCIQLLLTLYEEHQNDFLNKRHKKVYEDIASQMRGFNPLYTMNGTQCQSKINSLKKMYKKILDHNSTSGNDRATWPYFDRMNELFGSSGWAHPVATASEAGSEASGSLTPLMESPISTKKRKFDAAFEEYLKEKKQQQEEKAHVKQANINRLLELKEKHHKEKIELLWAIRNSLTHDRQ